MVHTAQDVRTGNCLSRPTRYALIGLLAACLLRSAFAETDPIPLNAAQFKGSHNSYERYESVQDQLGFNQIRQLEFDVRYVNGDWVVYHNDGGSFTWCYYLSGCLQEVRIWSKENPGHHAVFIWLDLKDRNWRPGGMESLDEAITANLDAETLFTPDQLRRWYPDHQTAAAQAGWPSLEALRNHFIIVLTGNAAMNDAYARSTEPALLGRPAFVNYEHNSPLWDFNNPQDPVRASYRVVFNLNLMPPIPSWKLDFIAEARARGLLTRAYNLAHNPNDWAILKQRGLHIFSSDWVNAIEYPHAVIGDPLGCNPEEAVCDAVQLGEPRGHILEAAVRSGGIEDRNDSFYFAYQRESPDPYTETLVFTASITHPDSFVEPAAKACLMARERATASSPYFAVCRPGGQPIRVYYRTADGETAKAVPLNLDKLPIPEGVNPENARFLKLVLSPERTTAAGYGSYNGEDWVLIERVTFARPLTRVGPAISSHNPKVRFPAWFVRYARNGKPVLQFTCRSCIGSDCTDGSIMGSGLYVVGLCGLAAPCGEK